uniref:Si:ch211-214j8.12 n=1 Tax=Maylandia zebra TaxID=106582 RepID=A0A3P9C5M2_9CICH
MPLFRALAERGGAKARPGRRRQRTGDCWRTDEDGPVLSLRQLSLLSLADNMKKVWVKDYTDNYLDQYSFRYIMGPFNLLTSELVEELTCLLCSRKKLSRAALHLLLPSALTLLHAARLERNHRFEDLDLSGAQQLPSKVISETLHGLPALRSLSLTGMSCDKHVIRTIAHRCRLLRHLDVSHCHLLSPGALLPLGGGSSSFPATLAPLPLSSLLALDIGFGVQEEEPVAAAAYLLLSLPSLERVAMEGVAKLEQVWQERRDKEGKDNLRMRREKTAVDRENEDEEEEGISWEEYRSGSEEDTSRDEGPPCSQRQSGQKRTHRSQSDFALKLKDVKGLTFDSLDSLGRLCPGICSMSVSVDSNENTRGGSKVSVLAAGLKAWSGQMQRLSVQFPGNLDNLLPSLLVAGSSLISLTLEGVKTNSYTRLLPVIRACPRLRDLLISAEPSPSFLQIEHEEDQQDNGDLPRLPNLCSLTLRLWQSIKDLSSSSLSLPEKLSLVSLPCPLDYTLQSVLRTENYEPRASAESTGSPLVPLGRVRHVDLQRTDVTIRTVKSLLQQSKRLKYMDVSCCWQISCSEWLACKKCSNVQIVWA